MKIKAKQKEEIWPQGMGQPSFPYSPAVKVGNWLFISGQSASDLTTGLSEEAIVPESFPYYTSPLAKQSSYLYNRVNQIIETAGFTPSNIVRANQWYKTKMAEGHYTIGDLTVDNKRYVEEKNRYFQLSPPSTGIGVRQFLVKDALVEVDFTGYLPKAGEVVEEISAPDIPKPGIGFVEGFKVGNWLFISGDIATDWKGNWQQQGQEGEIHALAPEVRTSNLFWGDVSIRLQTDYVLTKLSKVAEAAGTSLENTVKAHVYLSDPEDFVGFEEVWSKWFPDKLNAPARAIVPNVEIGAKGCRVEISLDILMPNAKREVLHGGWVPKSHEAPAIVAEDLVYMSGLMATDASGLASEARIDPSLPYVGIPGKKQMAFILKKAQNILSNHDLQLNQMVKATLYFSDLSHFAGAMEAWENTFGESEVKPALTIVEVNQELWVKGCHILADFTFYDDKEE
ncbi:MAG TPA: Rid family hydrolase [Ureibacillus sp.]|nr:Rid family hydrolase [Ureibacillus sp.]